jgi:cytochrome c
MRLTRMAGAGLALALTAWMAAGAAAPDPAKGKKVFEQCAVCHNVDSPAKKMGPSLQKLFKRLTEEKVRGQIDRGGNGMPGYKDILSAEEKNNLIAYLKTI